MKHLSGEKMTDEDLIAIYPSRIKRGKNYEVWQFAYVKDDTYHDNFDFAVVRFGAKSNDILLISQHQNRLDDRDYHGRVQLLVHDISTRFNVETKLVKKALGKKTWKIIKKFKNYKI